MGWDIFSLFFPLLWLFMPCLSSLSVTYGTLAHWFSVIMLVQSVLNRIFMVSYFTTRLYFLLHLHFLVRMSHLLCISYRLEKVLCFINSSLVGWSVCSLATSESLDMLSEDGIFQVFLEHVLVTMPQRLRLSMSQTHVQRSPTCHFPHTRYETLRCFWEKYIF